MGSSLQVAMRLPTEMVAAIDAIAARLQVERHGTVVTRSDVIREYLHRALAVQEPASDPGPARPPRRGRP